MINLNNLFDFIIIYKEFTKISSGSDEILTESMFYLKSVLEENEKKTQSRLSYSSPIPNINTDNNNTLNNIYNPYETKVRLIQLKWREYKVKTILNIKVIDKHLINELCRDYLKKQFESNSHNFSFVTDLFSLTFSFWEDLLKLPCFLETKNRIISIKLNATQSLFDFTSTFLTNIIKLTQIQRENLFQNESAILDY